MTDGVTDNIVVRGCHGSLQGGVLKKEKRKKKKGKKHTSIICIIYLICNKYCIYLIYILSILYIAYMCRVKSEWYINRTSFTTYIG